MDHVEAKFVPGLTRALKDPDTLNRWYAAQALARVGPSARSTLQDLIAALNQKEDVNLQTYAANALVSVGADDQLALRALRDHMLREGYNGYASANALAKAGKKGVPYLIEGLKSNVPYTIFAAAGAISEVGPDAIDAVPILIHLTEDQSKLTVAPPDSGQSSLGNVIKALKAIAPGDPRVKAALSQLSVRGSR